MKSVFDPNQADAVGESAEIFLCHNRLDAEKVALIADALELETGTLFFLDRYAIPTGVEFLEFIDRAMCRARGCAIFLGANGWGPTQFWEAELALSHYREDPDFRLIPVALPGLCEADMQRLGDGSVFSEINRSDLTQEPPGADELRNLAAAISGTAAPQFRTPARLTPYQLRRDAGRWREAASPRAARDILYQGEELKEAEAILVANPDFAVLSEVQPFIAAADRRQRDKLRRGIAVASLVSVVLCSLTIAAIVYASIAETRQQESLSRALAIQATQEETPRRQLLVALEALRQSNTPEAHGAVLSMLDEWQPLIELQSVASGIRAAVKDVSGAAIVTGSETGEIHRIAPGAPPERLADLGSSITAMAALNDGVVVGTLDGFAAMARSDGKTDTLIEGNGPQAYITAIAARADESIIAIGDHEGRVHLLRKSRAPALIDLTDDIAIESLVISEDGSMLAVATRNNWIALFETNTASEFFRWPLRNTVRDIAFLGEGRMAWITSTGLLQLATIEDDSFSIENSHQFGGLISSAKIYPAAGTLALGEANGFIQLTDFYGSPMAFDRIRAYGDAVAAIVMLDTPEHLMTTDARGGIAVWSLDISQGIGTSLPDLPMEPIAMSQDQNGILLGVSGSRHEAAVWRLQDDTWVSALDLVAETRTALGDNAAPLSDDEADTEGFVSLSETAIGPVALSQHSIAWSTWNGGLLVKDLDGETTAKVLQVPDGEPYQALAMSASGLPLAAARHESEELEVFGTNDGFAISIAMPSSVETLDITPSGSHVAAGLADGTIAKVSIQNRTFDLLPTDHRTPVGGVAFLSGTSLLSYGTGGDADRELLLHDTASDQNAVTIRTRRPGGAATATAFSEKLDVLAVADLNGELHLWRASDQRYIRSLFLAGTYLPAVTFDDEAQRVIAADGNGFVQAWPLDPTAWAQTICAKVYRPLSSLEWQDLMPGEPYAPACANDWGMAMKSDMEQD